MKRLLVAVAVLASSISFAQAEKPKVLKDKAAETFNEIEHGAFYTAVTGGFWALITPPSDGPVRPFSPGQSVQVEMGWDFGERVSAGIFVIGAANRNGSDYIGYSRDPQTGAARASVSSASTTRKTGSARGSTRASARASRSTSRARCCRTPTC
jgi:hypothetical protein